MGAGQSTDVTPTSEPCVACSEPGGSPHGSKSGNQTTSTASKTPFAYMHSGCPLNRRELGRATWAFLHTMAAYYPENPTKHEQEDMSQFMYTLGKAYPCGYCADTTSQEMIRNPPNVQSRDEFVLWMCNLHNEVNERLGKPVFDCSKARERWKTGPGDGSCD